MGEPVELDGAQGEGGGQILRTALALSLRTGRALRVRNVRAGRERPGLLRQHLAALRAAAAVGEAEVEGDALGSSEVSFRPTALRGGRHRFSVGSAGSATLVLQTVLPALLAAPEPSDLTIEGGTHNPWAPPYDFLEKAFLPLLRRMGARVEMRLEARGFHPAGGGLLAARIEPGPLLPLELLARGEVRARRARVVLENLPAGIADRETKTLRALLPWDEWTFEQEVVSDGRGPGNAVVLEVEAEHVTEVFTGFGRIGVRAEAVAREAVAEASAWLASGVPAGPHLADQLLLPLALAGAGAFRTGAPTRHATTNRDVIARFLPDAAPVFEADAAGTTVSVGPRGARVPATGAAAPRPRLG